MHHSRRSILSAISVALPFGLGTRLSASSAPMGTSPSLWFRSFEEAVRAAFADRSSANDLAGQPFPCRRIEIGHSERVRAGVQGCHNDRPFAGYPAGHLRIVLTGSQPGPVRQGMRLYVATVDVALTGGLIPGVPSRPLDFASLPPAPSFT
jgi:hypothetical protein